MVRAMISWLLLLGIAAGVYVYRVPFRVMLYQAAAEAIPCRIAIPYKIGTIDPDFKVSQAQVQRAAQQAIAVWEKATGRDLFVETAGAPVLTVNLAYDVRQETTQTLKNLGQQISNASSKYDDIKAQYDAERVQYQQRKDAYDAEVAAFNTDAAAYQQEVDSWNQKGGAPKSVSTRLNAERADLQGRQATIRQDQLAVNQLADQVNATALRLNSTAGDINATAKTYNKVGAQTGEEFEEGVFESAPGEESITVYEFDSEARLTRLLTHEFGHALGLEHVENEDSIMYKLNESDNIVPTPEDLAELKSACRM